MPALIAKGPADVDEALRQAIVGDHRLTPDPVEKLFLANQAVGVGHQVLQNAKRLWPQRDRLAVPQDRTTTCVDRKMLKLPERS